MSESIEKNYVLRAHHFRPDDEFFSRTAYLPSELNKRLFELIISHDFSDEEYDLLQAIYLATERKHRRFILDFVSIPEGQSTEVLRGAAIHRRIYEIGDFIDIGVAKGIKQDALIRDATDRWKVSRRDVFRYLKQVRKWRQELPPESELCDWDSYYGPELKIAPDGKLVPVCSD